MLAVLFNAPARDIWDKNAKTDFFNEFTMYPKRYDDVQKLCLNVIYDVVCNSAMIDRLIIKQKTKIIEKIEAEFDQQSMQVIEHAKNKQVYFLEHLNSSSKEYKNKALDKAVELLESLLQKNKDPQTLWEAIQKNEYPDDYEQYLKPLKESWFSILAHLDAHRVYAYQLDIFELELFLQEYPRAVVL